MTSTTLFDAVIIGGGPAGCSCAQWLNMLGFQACVVEKRDRLGGLYNDNPFPEVWNVTVPGRSGHEIATAMHDNIMNLDVSVVLNAEVIRVGAISDGFGVMVRQSSEPDVLRARFVVIASGVRAKAGGLRSSQTLLIGPGNHIAACDFSGKSVAILGGGDNAFENYLYVKHRGARHAAIFARTIRARREFIEKADASDVSHQTACLVDQECMTVNGQQFDYILVMYGWEPQLPPMDSIVVARGEGGFVAVDASTQTSVEGMYAIGEVTQRFHPCGVTAIADGVIAAKAIQKKIEARR